jgi:hypothetical protein
MHASSHSESSLDDPSPDDPYLALWQAWMDQVDFDSWWRKSRQQRACQSRLLKRYYQPSFHHRHQPGAGFGFLSRRSQHHNRRHAVKSGSKAYFAHRCASGRLAARFLGFTYIQDLSLLPLTLGPTPTDIRRDDDHPYAFDLLGKGCFSSSSFSSTLGTWMQTTFSIEFSLLGSYPRSIKLSGSLINLATSCSNARWLLLKDPGGDFSISGIITSTQSPSGNIHSTDVGTDYKLTFSGLVLPPESAISLTSTATTAPGLLK